MRPWNVLAPIEEMELEPRFKSKWNENEGKKEKEAYKFKRMERLEKTPSLKTVISLS